MKSFVSWSIKQRVLVNLSFVLFLILGVVVYKRLPIDAWPEVSLDEAWIETYWDGATAEEVERLITGKIEEEIDDLAGVNRIISQSQANLSFIDVKFDEDLSKQELETSFNDLRMRIDRVNDLPDDAEVPLLRRLTTSEVWPLFSVVVSTKDDSLPDLVLRELGEALKTELSEVPGVLHVRFLSYRDRELKVKVDPTAARRLGVSLPEVASALSRTNRSHPAGTFVEKQDVGRSEIHVRFDTDFVNPEDLEDAVVRVVPGKSPIRVRDVARVEFDFEKERMRARFNRQRAIVLNVAKDSDSNTIELRDECGVVIDKFKNSTGLDIDVDVVADQSEVVESRFRVLLDNLLQGMVLVALILFFSLGIRNALIALIGIPFSYLCAFILFPVFGLSINNLTLFGMVLVGGMLVDDAIIVIENMYRHAQTKIPFKEAVRRGASEVAWPVLNACTTSVAAMLPLLLQGGVAGKFFSNIPKVVILALIFSVIQCVTVLPVHYLEFGRQKAGKRGLLERARNAFFGTLSGIYVGMLGWVLRFRLAFLSLVLGVSVLLVGLVLQVKQDPWVSDFTAVFLSLECDSTYSLQMTEEAVIKVEAELQKLLDDGLIKNFYAISGFSMTADGQFIYRPYVAFYMATLSDRRDVVENPEKLVNRMNKEIGAKYPQFKPNAFAPHDGPPLGKPVAVRVESNDYRKAKHLAEQIKAALSNMEGVDSISDNLLLGPREVRVRADPERAAALGFFPTDLAVTLRAANDGLIVGSFKDRKLDEDVDVRVQYDHAKWETASDLLNTDVATPSGKLVPVRELSSVDVSRPIASYYHYDTRRTVLVTANVDGVVATGPQINQELQKIFADAPDRYPDIRLTYGGEFEETHKSMEQQTRAFWIAVILIYVLLAAQFKSYKQPLIVMAVVPFSVLGVLLGLWVMNQPFTIPTFIAMIGLAGVVVNDSLVLVEFINLRRADGLKRMDAVVTGAQQRFRPIFLTATTTMGNLTPLAFGLGGVSRVWTPFAVSIVFGMAVASLMTLFMVPVLYSLLVRK